LEEKIIHNALVILWNEKNIQILIQKINRALEVQFEEDDFTEHTKKYGCHIIIDYTNISTINCDNIKDVYEQCSKYHHMNNIRKKRTNDHFIWKQRYQHFSDYDSYLFCLFHFKFNNCLKNSIHLEVV